MSRIANHKKEIEDLKNQMFKFCLNPLPEVFEAIRKNARVHDTDGYDLWERAVIVSYSKIWEKMGYSTIPHLSASAEKEYITEMERLVTRAKMQPRQIILDKMLMVFCATGDVDYLQTIYEIGGDISASEKLRGMALDSYTHIRNEFDDYTSNEKLRDIDWVNNHKVMTTAKVMGLGNTIADAADAFAEIDRRINDHLRAMERDNTVDEKIVDEFRKAAQDVTQKFSGTLGLSSAPLSSQATSQATSSEVTPASGSQSGPKLSFKKQKRLDKVAKKLARKEALKAEFSKVDREEAANDMAKAEQQFDELASKLK